MRERVLSRKEAVRSEEEWGNLFALGAQQERGCAILLGQRQAERQQRTNEALRCGDGEWLKMRLHCRTIAQPPQQFKLRRRWRAVRRGRHLIHRRCGSLDRAPQPNHITRHQIKQANSKNYFRGIDQHKAKTNRKHRQRSK